jgi:hypothetical protein
MSRLPGCVAPEREEITPPKGTLLYVGAALIASHCSMFSALLRRPASVRQNWTSTTLGVISAPGAGILLAVAWPESWMRLLDEALYALHQ